MKENNDNTQDERDFGIQIVGSNSWDGDSTLSSNIYGVGLRDEPSFIIIKDELFQSVSSGYGIALKSFILTINHHLIVNNVPPEKVKPIQESIEAFANGLKAMEPDQDLESETVKTLDMRAKIFSVIRSILEVLPNTTEAIAAFRILAPFSKQIGEPIQYLVEAVHKDL